MSKPITRIMVPETKPVGNEAATPRYGSGNVKTYTDIGTARCQHANLINSLNILQEENIVNFAMFSLRILLLFAHDLPNGKSELQIKDNNPPTFQKSFPSF